jgi:plastocyanin
MKGARALASGTLVLALSCAIPAISAAQDAGTTTDAETTTATTSTPTTPAAPPAPADAPPEGASGGGLSSSNSESAVRDAPGSSSPGVPAAASPAVASAAASTKAQKSASASVTMGDFFFSPASVSVAVGDTVTWRNTGQAPHNAVADDGSFKTADLNQGESASHRFSQEGTFSYLCTIHPQMTGTVRVLSSSGGGGGGGGGDTSSSAGSSATSEEAAVASPDAAGDANTLPMTGMAAGGLALVGLGLLALGLIARQADRERSRRRWLPIF